VRLDWCIVSEKYFLGQKRNGWGKRAMVTVEKKDDYSIFHPFKNPGSMVEIF
jgi:hypothetical protein